MSQVVVLSLTAALNPTLVAASTVMLLLPDPKRLMLGYLLGALLMSITLGLVIVFALQGSDVVSSTKKTLSPAADLALGALALTLAVVVASRRDKHIAERRRERKGPKEDKGPPKWQRFLSKGSPRDTFAVGALLTLPGASYLAGLDTLGKLHYSTAVTVLVVVGFNLVMLVLLELPLLGFVLAPDATPGAVERSKAWVGRHGRRAAVIALAALGITLVVKGTVGLVS